MCSLSPFVLVYALKYNLFKSNLYFSIMVRSSYSQNRDPELEILTLSFFTCNQNMLLCRMQLCTSERSVYGSVNLGSTTNIFSFPTVRASCKFWASFPIFEQLIN